MAQVIMELLETQETELIFITVGHLGPTFCVFLEENFSCHDQAPQAAVRARKDYKVGQQESPYPAEDLC